MADITVRNEPEKRASITQSQSWEPFRIFRHLLDWDPFRQMAPLVAQGQLAFAPDFDVKETKDQYVFRADMPGVKASDLDVSMAGGRLTISGKRESEREEKGETYYASERSYGSFFRAFTLPEGANASAVNADLRDGVLTVSVAKLPEVQAKKIPVATPGTKH